MADMFDQLPEPLVLAVISFLPFRDAARTSALSRHWRHLWRSTANIDLDEQFFVRVQAGNQEAQRLQFVQFIRQWIYGYTEPVLQRFRLRLSEPQEFNTDVLDCISFAVERKARVLELDFSHPSWNENDAENHLPEFEVPDQFYEDEMLTMLESLTLFSCTFNPARLINLRLLKHVSLGWIQLHGSTIKSLLKNCRLLESLSLKKCWDIDGFSVFGGDMRLRTLLLDNCRIEQNWFEIEVPELRFFKYSGALGNFRLLTNGLIEEADLDFGFEMEFNHDGGYLLQGLLQTLDSVRVLKVCSYMLQVVPIGEEPRKLRSPLNVRHLILKTAVHGQEFWGIAFFLKSCPLLETLTLQMSPPRILPDYWPPYPFIQSKFWSSEDRVCSCTRRTIKVVEVKGFRGSINELYLLRHLLFHGRAMREFRLYVSDEVDYFNGGNPSIYEQRAIMVRSYPRASRDLYVMIGRPLQNR